LDRYLQRRGEHQLSTKKQADCKIIEPIESRESKLNGKDKWIEKWLISALLPFENACLRIQSFKRIDWWQKNH
jgi:hypothetical protein